MMLLTLGAKALPHTHSGTELESCTKVGVCTASADLSWSLSSAIEDGTFNVQAGGGVMYFVIGKIGGCKNVGCKNMVVVDMGVVEMGGCIREKL